MIEKNFYFLLFTEAVLIQNIYWKPSWKKNLLSTTSRNKLFNVYCNYIVNLVNTIIFKRYFYQHLICKRYIFMSNGHTKWIFIYGFIVHFHNSYPYNTSQYHHITTSPKFRIHYIRLNCTKLTHTLIEIHWISNSNWEIPIYQNLLIHIWNIEIQNLGLTEDQNENKTNIICQLDFEAPVYRETFIMGALV